MLQIDFLSPHSPARPVTTLGQVRPGQTVRILGYGVTERSQKKHLLSLGLTPGTLVEVERVAPLGDPLQVQVRGFHLGLRRAEADTLLVAEVEHE